VVPPSIDFDVVAVADLHGLGWGSPHLALRNDELLLSDAKHAGVTIFGEELGGLEMGGRYHG
jgi:hypothetical protein